MRMPLFVILNFLIMDVVIISLIHLIMIMIFPFSIFLSHWSLMICLLVNWNFSKMSREFNLSWWLCEVLVVLRSFPLPIRNVLNISRLLITLSHTLKIILFYNFRILPLYHTILPLNKWRIHMWWAWLQSDFSFFLYDFPFLKFESLFLHVFELQCV